MSTSSAPPTVQPRIVVRSGPTGIIVDEPHYQARRIVTPMGLLVLAPFLVGIGAIVIAILVATIGVAREEGLLMGLLGGAMCLLGMVPFLALGAYLGRRLVRQIRTDYQIGAGSVTFSQWPLYLGAESTVSLRMPIRHTQPLESFAATLLCYEFAQQGAGTDRMTWSYPVWERPLPTDGPAPAVDQIEARWHIRIPPDQPPSFYSADSEIRWVIEVKAKVAGSAEKVTQFPLLVLPQRRA